MHLRVRETLDLGDHITKQVTSLLFLKTTEVPYYKSDQYRPVYIITTSFHSTQLWYKDSLMFALEVKTSKQLVYGFRYLEDAWDITSV